MTTSNLNIQPNVNNSNVVLAAQPSEIGVKKTMSSLEMAELAEKPHNDLLKSIRNMEPAWTKVTGGKFSLSSYIDSTGRKLPCYNFNYEESMYIASKFDDETRAKLVLRWAKLETGKAEPMYIQQPKQEQKPASLNDKMKTATWAAKFLNMNDNSKLILAKPILEQVGLPIPDYTPSKGVLSSAKELLSKRNIIHNGKQLTTKVLNEILEKNGIIRTLTRKTSKGQDKPFKNITEKGSVYGENQVSQYDARETQPLWFVEKFDELLKAVGLQPQSELF